MKIKTTLITLLACLCFSTLALAQDDDAIKSTVNAYLDGITKGDTALLGKAFHPTAILRTFNASTGKIQDFPVKNFIRNTPAGGAKATTKLVGYSYAGVSATATVELEFQDFKYIDLLSLLKVNDEWKIVCRVFSRVDNDVQIKGSAGVAAKTPASTSKKVVKPKKDDGW
ncbi:nuclear transport factor 2 family protein [Aquirufa aurantiipilula]|uniref:Nuclear transport factor 2 family protein n=1 Tax=Aquirufa aurantiipilula TaxID=2696561 RepID=A0ABT6BJ27_9BACT|nr:nuclear transport factor 2 family protein [Aquirufa aurantiipilula]MBZ1325965.1 nuclear transport factor 2 family protein [Aquirufa aurantiipilula]MDF5690472.1 nuclear transport factor 2 family protein [Aquirufa aurantiipilula]